MNSIKNNNSHSLTVKVFEEIEQAILSGVCSVGDQLVESKISLELGVSRTPVREALKQLELDAQKVFDTECRATDIYNLALSSPLECGTEQRMKLLKTEELL